MTPEVGARDLALSAGVSAVGFQPDPESGGFRRGELVFDSSGGWCEVRRRVPHGGGGTRAVPLGRPGLWRRVSDLRPGGHTDSVTTTARSGAESIVEEVFESPANLLIPEHGADLLSLWLAWALATKDGDAPDGWCCPSPAEIERWIGPGEPIARAGAIIRQGAIVRDERRLALRVPILPRVQTPLPEHRAAWLGALLEDAASRWRMVRIGMPGDAASPLALAEIDLTGAPPALLPDLVRNGVQALRLVVEWLALPAAFLANDNLPCRALEVCLPRA